MSIRPVDMQLVVQKNQDVHQAKQTVVSKLDNELIHAQKENRDVSLKKLQTVNQTERSELKRVKNDSETDEEKRRRKSKKKSAKAEENEIETEDKNVSKPNGIKRSVSNLGTRFDMKV